MTFTKHIKKKTERREKDSLTGCYTRRYVFSMLEKKVEQDLPFTVFMIDLNKFKNINDLQGHHVGDVVLKEVGHRFDKLKNEKLIFARLGGDEFLAVYLGTQTDKINEIGNKINNIIKEHISYDNFEYAISASIGIARFPDDGDSVSDLLSLADFAMYHAKRNNLGTHLLVTDELGRQIARRQKIKKLLKSIDYEKDLSLKFQPQFEAKSKKIIGMDSIVQWNHKEEGVIHRSEFLPVAEELGVIQYSTKWIFLNSLAQIQKWNEKYGQNLCMNIDVSQSCIYHKIFFGNVAYMVDFYRIKPHWLRISLNEHSMMHSPEYLKKLLADISKLGVNISILDFGSGTISIRQIMQLFVDCLRIGPDIIHGCEKDSNKYKTLKGIVMMAQGMGLRTAANTIENFEQYKIANELGCKIMQGDYIEKPLTADEFEKKYLSKG